jgi:hypothetical protein
MGLVDSQSVFIRKIMIELESVVIRRNMMYYFVL